LEPIPFGPKREEADKLVEDAQLLERLGCFALVLEKIPASKKR
jgi:3-methyl-2-oxobutanoate hydroxymethyltransferase